MKKKWYGIIAAVMALLVLASTTVPVLAQSEEEVMVDSESTLTVPKALGIWAPRVAPVGKEVTMTVFQRGTQDPIEGAGIWALTRDEAEALRAGVTQMREESGIAAAQDQDYESLVSIHGTFLGKTDENGQLKHTFTETGGYLLVAVKKGYIPGFAPIRIRTIPETLAIKAPRVAPVGEEVTMTVFQRLTQDPVEGAAIWALTRDEAEALKAEVTQMREEDSIAAGELDYESLVSVHGFRLGFTDEDGQLKHTFDEAGWYLLVVVKKGYIPGFKPIRIGEIPHVLGLKVQWVALVSEEVTMTVFQRGTQELAEGAGIWAGHTDNYIKVYTKSSKDLTNKLLPVRLVELFKQGGVWGVE